MILNFVVNDISKITKMIKSGNKAIVVF